MQQLKVPFNSSVFYNLQLEAESRDPHNKKYYLRLFSFTKGMEMPHWWNGFPSPHQTPCQYSITWTHDPKMAYAMGPREITDLIDALREHNGKGVHCLELRDGRDEIFYDAPGRLLMSCIQHVQMTRELLLTNEPFSTDLFT